MDKSTDITGWRPLGRFRWSAQKKLEPNNDPKGNGGGTWTRQTSGRAAARMVNDFLALRGLAGDNLMARTLAFANRHGSLGQPGEVWTLDKWAAEIKLFGILQDAVERLTHTVSSGWLRTNFQIQRSVIEIAPSIRERDQFLDQLVSLEPTVLQFIGSDEVHNAYVIVAGPLSWSDEDRVLRFAQQAIANEIQHRLKRCFDLEVDLDRGITFTARDTKCALYASLARRMTGQRLAARQCKGCPTMFVPRRANHKYHTEECKARSNKSSQRDRAEKERGGSHEKRVDL